MANLTSNETTKSYRESLELLLKNQHDLKKQIEPKNKTEYHDSEPDKSKRKLLDALAELAATQKGGRFITSTAMSESEHKITIWITRNLPFGKEDQSQQLWFDELAKLLENRTQSFVNKAGRVSAQVGEN